MITIAINQRSLYIYTICIIYIITEWQFRAVASRGVHVGRINMKEEEVLSIEILIQGAAYIQSEDMKRAKLS